MLTRVFMLIALTMMAFGGNAMAGEMPTASPANCAANTACCPDGHGIPQTSCVTCCVMAPATPVIAVVAEIEPVAALAATPAIFVQRIVRPLDPPPRNLGQIETTF